MVDIRSDSYYKIVTKWNKLASDPLNQYAMGHHKGIEIIIVRNIRISNKIC